MSDKEMINRYIEYLINQSESKDHQNRYLLLKIGKQTEKITSLLEEKQKEGSRVEKLITELYPMNAEFSKSCKKNAKLEEQLNQPRQKSSAAGAVSRKKISAVHHSTISTLKLCGKSVWNFFEDFFICEVLRSESYKDDLTDLIRE